MDCKTGEIIRSPTKPYIEQIEKRRGRPLAPLSEREYEELAPLGATVRKNHMRNKPCVCGSGRKFKRCCWGVYT